MLSSSHVSTTFFLMFQDEFLPGVTKASVAEGLAARFGADGGSVFFGRDLSGWYLQQVRAVPR